MRRSRVLAALFPAALAPFLPAAGAAPGLAPCAATAVAAYAALGASAAFAQEAPTVVDIEFRGNKRYSDDTLRLSLRTKRGQKLDRALLPEDERALLEYFETVELTEERVAGGVKLIFSVVESPPVVRVDLVGVDEVSEIEVRAVIDTSAGRPIAEFRVQNDRRKIERLYRSKGYHFVQVAPRTEDRADGKAVIFEVLEGPGVEIEDIVFEGNVAFPEDVLLDHALMRERKLFGLRPGPYVEETVRQDLLSIRNFYRFEGWLDAEVALLDREFSDDKSRVTVRIQVSEGPAYTVGTVAIEGVRSYPGGADALLPLLAFTTGDRKSQETINRATSAIERAYREEGYFAVVVTSEERLHPNAPVADVILRVEEASKVRVRSLYIAGNVVTQDKVIRREIPLAPGEVLNQNSIEKGRSRLRGLGYFERVGARVEPPAEGDDPNQRDVTFEVDDTATTGTIGFGVSVDSDNGLSASVRLTKRNFDWKDLPEGGRIGEILRGRAFTGAGQTFELELSPGSDYSQYRVAFSEPWLFDKPISYGWNLFYTNFQRFDFDMDARGIDFFLGRRWRWEGRERDTVFGIQGRTRIESHEVSNVSRDSAPTAFLAQGSQSLISEELTFRLSRLDSDVSPTQGWFGELSTEFGFAGDVRLWRNSVEGRRFWLLGRDDDELPHVLSFGAKLSWANPMGSSAKADANLFDTEYVPVYEGYLAGGTSSSGAIRGFSYGGAGPHGEGNPFLARQPGESAAARRTRLTEVARSVLENDGDPMAGRVLFVASTEYTFPLYQNVLRGVVFCDAGMSRHSFSSSHGLDEDIVRSNTTGLRFSDGESFFSDVRVSVGFGVRVRIPILGPIPLALDFGIPIRKQDGDDTQVVSFSVRRDF